jgi:hypothetical protein
MAQRRRQNTNPKRQDRGNGNTQYLDDFVRLMDRDRELNKPLSYLNGNEEDSPEKKKQARKYIDEKGFEKYIATYEDDTNEEELNETQKKELAQKGYRILLDENRVNIGKTLDEHIDNILNNINPENLERLASNERIREAGGQEYSGLLEKVAQYNGFRDLAERFERGEAKHEEIEPLQGLIAQELAEKYRTKLKEEGADDELIETIVDVAIEAARIGGFKKEYTKSAIDKLTDKTKNEIEEAGLNLADYVKDSIKRLRSNDNPQDTAIARQLIYAACQMSKEGSN